MASQNNITLVEIKLYENKITVTNFPEIIKGESHIITFTITKLIKDYGEYTSDASLIWKKLSPKSSNGITAVKETNPPNAFELYLVVTTAIFLPLF